MIPFKDISSYQGLYDMSQNSDEIVAVKMSGGDLGLYYDSQASRNYANAVSQGKAVGGYHFAGGTDPVQEAHFFVRAMSPLAENDVLILDWEVQHGNPVNWCLAFVNTVRDQTGVWPLIYMNISTLNSYDWSSVLQNCGLWLAAPSFGFDETIPMVHHVYVAQQGVISNGVDTNTWFGTVDQFRAYGYHAIQQAPIVATPPVDVPVVVVPPVVPKQPSDPIVVPPIVTPEPPFNTDSDIPAIPIVNTPVIIITKQSWLKRLQDAFLSFIAWLIS